MNKITLDALIVIASALWWVLLATISRVPFSELQVSWGLKANLAIFAYFPICILFGFFGSCSFLNPMQLGSAERVVHNKNLTCLFWVVFLVFALQCLFHVPPLLSNDPSSARLTWGIKYLHVLTEIVFRFSVLVNLSRAWLRGKIELPEALVILASIVYAFLVVSRGLILEFLLYLSITILAIGARRSEAPLALVSKSLALLVIGAFFFVIYGNWRQGSNFSIAEYGKMHTQNTAISWFFGYFLVNFDNLALLIDQEFQNPSVSNVFGPLLQSLQIIPYEDVDNYLYVGKFNLGTAFRPFVLDYSVFGGGVAFCVLWFFWLKSAHMCIYAKNRTAILLLLAYVGFCLPVTGRMEQPPYLFVLLAIFVFDKYEYLKGLEKDPRSLNDKN